MFRLFWSIVMKTYKYRKDFVVDGRRYTVRADTKRELIEKETRKRMEIESGNNRVDSNMLLKDWATQCINAYKTNQGPSTRKGFMQIVNHCILEHIGDMRLKDIKPLHCQNVINLQAGKSKTQINGVYQALNFLFRHAVANDLLKKNPAENITRPVGTKHARRALTAHERAHFIRVGYLDRRYYIYLLMVLCGCRPGEAAEAMGRDILMMEGYPMLHIRGTKTKNADRIVPIPPELYEVIKDIPADQYIAVSQAGGRITKNTKRTVWRSYCRQINLSMGCKTYRNALVPPFPLAPDIVPYCLRHEYCTELARQGVDIRTAQKLMGHSDIRLTANIYTNLDHEDIIEVARRINEGAAPGAAEKGTKSYKNNTIISL